MPRTRRREASPPADDFGGPLPDSRKRTKYEYNDYNYDHVSSSASRGNFLHQSNYGNTGNPFDAPSMMPATSASYSTGFKRPSYPRHQMSSSSRRRTSFHDDNASRHSSRRHESSLSLLQQQQQQQQHQEQRAYATRSHARQQMQQQYPAMSHSSGSMLHYPPHPVNDRRSSPAIRSTRSSRFTAGSHRTARDESFRHLSTRTNQSRRQTSRQKSSRKEGSDRRVTRSQRYQSGSRRKSSRRAEKRPTSSRRSSAGRREKQRRRDHSGNRAGGDDDLRSKPVPTKDDSEGHLIYRMGDLIADRYEITKQLGEGTFGKVAEVVDHRQERLADGSSPPQSRLALKIIKSVEKYREAAKLEINVLEKINAADPTGKFLCVAMRHWFDFSLN